MPKGSIFYNRILSSPLVVGVTRDAEIELRFTHPSGVWLHCHCHCIPCYYVAISQLFGHALSTEGSHAMDT